MTDTPRMLHWFPPASVNVFELQRFTRSDVKVCRKTRATTSEFGYVATYCVTENWRSSGLSCCASCRKAVKSPLHWSTSELTNVRHPSWSAGAALPGVG